MVSGGTTLCNMEPSSELKIACRPQLQPPTTQPNQQPSKPLLQQPSLAQTCEQGPLIPISTLKIYHKRRCEKRCKEFTPGEKMQFTCITVHDFGVIKSTKDQREASIENCDKY